MIDKREKAPQHDSERAMNSLIELASYLIHCTRRYLKTVPDEARDLEKLSLALFCPKNEIGIDLILGIILKSGIPTGQLPKSKTSPDGTEEKEKESPEELLLRGVQLWDDFTDDTIPFS
jgi:hypothetical protein